MNPFVLVWCLTSAAGIILSLLLMTESILDLRALGGIGNGRVLHAKSRIALEGIRVIIYSGFLFIGVPALTAPTEASPAIYVLIGANLLLLTKSVITWYVRRAAGVADATSLRLETKAVEAAMKLRETADLAAAQLVELAARTAISTTSHLEDAAERTAENTARIAENTDPANGSNGS